MVAPTISTSVMQQNNNITVCEYINGRQHTFTIDTSATRSVIRPDVVKGKYEAISNVRLRTASGETATVHGKTQAKVTIVNIGVSHVFIAADIVDEVIIGVNLNMEQRL